MFIVVIRGKSVERYTKGWTALPCPRCKKIQPFVCEDAYQSKSLYFVEYANSKIGELITCNFCGTSYATKEGLAIDIDTFWDPSQGLQVLVDKTNPELGKVPTQDGHTDDELLALLMSIKDESSLFKKDVTPGVILGGIAGVAFAVLLGIIGVFHEGPGDNISFVFIPPALGAVAGALWWGRREKRKVIDGALNVAVSRHSINTRNLARVCRANAASLGPISAVVEQLQTKA
jgi:hypothetical protein